MPGSPGELEPRWRTRTLAKQHGSSDPLSVSLKESRWRRTRTRPGGGVRERVVPGLAGWWLLLYPEAAEAGGSFRYSVPCAANRLNRLGSLTYRGARDATTLGSCARADDVLDQAAEIMGQEPSRVWSSDQEKDWQGPPAVWAAWGG